MARTGPSETDKIMTMKFFMHRLTNGAFTFPPIAGHVRVQMVDLRVPPDKLVVKHLAAIDLEKNTMPGGRQVLSPLVSAEIGEASDEFLLDACSSLKEFGYLESWCTEFRASCKSNPTIKATPNSRYLVVLTGDYDDGQYDGRISRGAFVVNLDAALKSPMQ